MHKSARTWHRLEPGIGPLKYIALRLISEEFIARKLPLKKDCLLIFIFVVVFVPANNVKRIICITSTVVNRPGVVSAVL